MLSRLRRALARRRLKDPAYDFLFHPAPEGEVVSVDCETTGLDRHNDDIITLAAVRVRGNRVLTSQKLDLVVKPSRPIRRDAVCIHHLREQDVERGLAPREAVERFLRFAGSRPLIGYYLEFDVALIDRLVRPWLGIGLPNPRIEVSEMFYDWRTRGREELYTGTVDLRFATILEALDIPPLHNHDAFEDAVMTSLAYLKLRARANR
ncbi:DNA polymerase III subunit epsilon [Rhodospirillum rubrum]|uniref:3'-5' exonuclease n=1 Tax=Rhodospirillum rubrum TaxID=1085 RepID=UPI001905A348|nr:3'-5' exonuclease [Rhodospirillum rubrum]MBK1665379.1 DNA polymerase III subunit epsilon [Rhodospirillum rubrum]MBK1677450.1 DNA polymerase III subunit epsilon [Rhodospirillum rubrum]